MTNLNPGKEGMYTQGFEFTNFTGKNFSNGCRNGFLGFSAKDLAKFTDN